MPYQQSALQIDEENIVYRYFRSTNPHNKTLAIIVHGAGQAKQQQFVSMAEYLQQFYDVLTFDFSGHGLSSSHQLSSIAIRDRQLQTLIKHVLSQTNLTHIQSLHIYALSMGGQNALNLLDKFSNIQQLILFSPALYHVDCFDLTFDHHFSQAIRTPNSWQNNNAVQQFTFFSGKLYLIHPPVDNVIPQGVFDCYRISSLAQQSIDFKEIIIDDAPHNFGQWFMENPQRFERIYKELT
ncbi:MULTISPECIES: alpha/beta hydrolase [unclassified Acinetobacter]|uniref:alpha/beta hydrolase n=1 Tax=unclassified Acinetobacter TaxID=196816 RepID=UPI0035B8CF08